MNVNIGDHHNNSNNTDNNNNNKFAAPSGTNTTKNARSDRPRHWHDNRT